MACQQVCRTTCHFVPGLELRVQTSSPNLLQSELPFCKRPRFARASAFCFTFPLCFAVSRAHTYHVYMYSLANIMQCMQTYICCENINCCIVGIPQASTPPPVIQSLCLCLLLSLSLSLCISCACARVRSSSLSL